LIDFKINFSKNHIASELYLGSIYDGRWVDGKWHGAGELIHQNHRYVGYFDQGIPTGKGK